MARAFAMNAHIFQKHSKETWEFFPHYISKSRDRITTMWLAGHLIPYITKEILDPSREDNFRNGLGGNNEWETFAAYPKSGKYCQSWVCARDDRRKIEVRVLGDPREYMESLHMEIYVLERVKS